MSSVRRAVARRRAPSATTPGQPLAPSGGVPRSETPEPVAGGIPSVSGREQHWVSTAAVRQAIGAWAYSLGAGERRPGPEDVRAALGVACAIHEMALDPARQRWRVPSAVNALSTSVPEDLEQLAMRSGFGARETARALDLLVAVLAVSRQLGAAGATVVLADSILSPAPAVAALDWNAVRDRIAVVGTSLAPALAVLRELAGMQGTLAPQGDFAAVRASVRDLEDATGFGRSTVSEALGGLERARLLDVEARAGRTTRFRIRPAALGHGDELPQIAAVETQSSDAIAPIHPVLPRDVGAVDAALGASAVGTRVVAPLPPLPVGAPTFVGEFAGTPIYAPSGTPVVIDCDAEGRWTCQVGPFLTLGPTQVAK